jgi:DNA-binding transcriptional LysR family regulator
MEDDGEHIERPSLRELEALHAVVTFSKMTAAAAALGISQPAVSRSIASLEERLGRTLFNRASGQLIPTKEAMVLDAEAVRIINAFDRLTLNLARGDAPPTRIKIATTATYAHHYLVRILPRFLAREADFRAHVEIGTSADVERAVTDREADLGLLDEPTPHPGIRIEVIRRSAAHVLLPADHPLAAKQFLDAGTLSQERLIALPHRFQVRALIDRAFHDVGLEPRIVMEAATSAFAAEMVRRGVGLSILNPLPLMIEPANGLVSREFLPTIDFNTAVVTSSSVSSPAAVRRFVVALRDGFDPISSAEEML